MTTFVLIRKGRCKEVSDTNYILLLAGEGAVQRQQVMAGCRCCRKQRKHEYGGGCGPAVLL